MSLAHGLNSTARSPPGANRGYASCYCGRTTRYRTTIGRSLASRNVPQT
jgi:hypothetical protein